MNYLFRLSGEIVDGQPVCCLGSQLAHIVSLLSECLGEVVWYSTDVDLVGHGFPVPAQTLQVLGRSPRLIELANKVDQFLRGVFLAVDAKIPIPQFRKDIDTEDAVEAELGNAIIEIRTFDTTYFELYTQDSQLAEYIERTFGVRPSNPRINLTSGFPRVAPVELNEVD
jgi:hypothetical protein